MARSVNVIQSQIITSIAANPYLTYTDSNGIVRNIVYNTSTRAVWRAFTFIVASAIAVFEQLLDIYVAQIETILSQTSAASFLWVQYRMFQFQYDATNPQVVQLINGVPSYPVVDPSLCPFTACSVYLDITNTVQVKVAVGNPLAPASSQVVAAAQSYITQIGSTVNYNVVSLTPDAIYIQADIFYNGMYSAVIQANVIAALQAYLQYVSQQNFDGSLLMSDIETVLKGRNVLFPVDGVNDAVLKNVYIRRNNSVVTDPVPVTTPTGFPLITNKTWVNRIYTPDSIPYTAGYYATETTTNFQITDSLNFIAQ